MTAYKILLADPLAGMGLEWPEGCALVRQLEPGTAGTHWHELSDPGAPADLEGREVDLRLGRGEDGEPVIRSRRAIEVHKAPGEDDTGLPCCGIHPADLPRGDRVSPDPELATCGGAAWAA